MSISTSMFGHVPISSLKLNTCLYFRAPSTSGKPGKMIKVFPVMEKSWNFIILPNIMEKWGKPWKKGLPVIFACDFFLLYRALPIQMYFWEKFWASVVFSDGRVLGASWAGMLLDYKKGERASANSCPQVASSEACPHCISQPVHPAWGRLRLGRETRVSHLVRV